MTNDWKPDRRGAEPGGDVGGDIQAGGSYEILFAHPRLPRAAIVVWVYPVFGDPDGPFRPDPPGLYRVDVQTEYTICDDPQHPGDTEEWAVERYATEPGQHDSLPAAKQAAREIAGKFASGQRLPDRDWDGRCFQ